MESYDGILTRLRLASMKTRLKARLNERGSDYTRAMVMADDLVVASGCTEMQAIQTLFGDLL
jgi:hypothetical protein